MQKNINMKSKQAADDDETKLGWNIIATSWLPCADLIWWAPHRLNFLKKEEGVISTYWCADGGETLEEEEVSDQQLISELDRSVHMFTWAV